MSIKILSESLCDSAGCGIIMCIDDKCYCEWCYQDLLKRIDELEKELAELTLDLIAAEKNQSD